LGHLTVNSLNSLAEILREASPLYAECQSIINNLASSGAELPAPSSATEQARLPRTTRRPQPGNGNRLDAIGVKDFPQSESDALVFGSSESEENGSKFGVLSPPDRAEADSVIESSPAVLSGNTSIINVPRGVERWVRHSDCQREDGLGKDTTDNGTDGTSADARRREPVLRSPQATKNAASESPMRLQRAGTLAPNPKVIPQFEEFPQVSPVLMARYDREKLYEEVWSLPMQQVARGYGVSDVAIGKTCRNLYIPVPGRGYWAKRAAHQPIEPRPPLPVIQTSSQPSEGRPQQVVTKTASAALPQASPLKRQHVIDPVQNQHPPAHCAVIDRVSPVLLARYDRERLYNKVWAMPVRLAASEYGVSNVAIAKTCRKLHIPVPGRGYWAKKAANRPVEPRPPLPQLLAET
jgi:hypothetical protein